MASELHVLNDGYLDRRAAGEDSTAALRGTAERLYVQVVVGANNDRLPPPWGPRRFVRYLRWTWLIEGAAQYYSGQVPLFRAAVEHPPARAKAARVPAIGSRRDHPRGTIFDLLERERGPDACDVLASRLRRDGPRAALELAFGARGREIERSGAHTCASCSERRLDDELGGLELPTSSPPSLGSAVPQGDIPPVVPR